MLVVDSGERFRVHPDLLELGSPRLAQQMQEDGSSSSVLLPDVTGSQALFLLHALYAQPSLYDWAASQPQRSLLDLAGLSSSLGFVSMVSVLEQALVKATKAALQGRSADHVGSWLSPNTVLSLYELAHHNKLAALQMELAICIACFCRTGELKSCHLHSADSRLLVLLEAMQQQKPQTL